MACFGLINKANNSNIPLKSISISSKLHGLTSEVVATLEYLNQSSNPVEVVYIFPLDEEAAVCDFQATINGRTIVAEIQEKQEARDLYDDAISSGFGAFLLEESDESSDIFQINVGNLPPGVSASVKITFVTILKVEKEGRVVFVLPSVLNPRYTPSNDEASVSNTFNSLASLSNKYSLNFEMNVQCASPIQEINSPCNRLTVNINPDDNRQATVRLNEKFDDDLVVHVLCRQPFKAHALVENGVTKSTHGTPDPFLSKPVVMLNFFPEFDTYASLERGEFLFIVDQSGSMGGSKIKSARESLLLFLKSLPENCYFNVIGFGYSFKKLFERSELYNDSSLSRACSYCENMEACLGGTEILAPLREVFSQPLLKGYPRQIFLLTDGEVSNTREVIELVRSNATKARCFTFGIGEGASSQLVKGVARAGRGTAEFVSHQDRLQTKVMKTLKHALQPAVKDISLTWNLPKTWTAETVPRTDLTVFSGNALVVFGLLSRKDAPSRTPITAIEGTVTLSGNIDDGKRSSVIQHVLKFSAVCGNPAETSLLLHRLCAKASIMDEDCDYNVIQLSKSANITSKLTSFVAVDKQSRVVVSKPIVSQAAQPMQLGRVFGFYAHGAPPPPPPASMPMYSMPPGAPATLGGSPQLGGAIPPSPMGSMPVFGVLARPPAAQCMGGAPHTKGGPPPPPPPVSHPFWGAPSAQMGAPPPPPAPPRQASSKFAGSKIMKRQNSPVMSGRNNESPQRELTHLSLISLQTASGAWQLTDKLASICGVTLNEIKRACPSQLPSDTNHTLWATALALACLTGQFPGHRDEWEMVSAKGTKWLKANLPRDGISYDSIMHLASRFFPTR